MAFRKPGTHKKGGKFLAFGDTNSGKTYFALTFPDSAVSDSESGTAHYEDRPITIAGQQYQNMRMVSTTADLDELEENLSDIISGEYDGEIKTFVVDSETKFYAALQVAAMTVEERRARKKGDDVDDATISQRQWGRIKLIHLKLQQAKLDASARGIHVVSVAQATDERDKKNPDKIIGTKPDMYKSAKFDYDTVLHFYTEEKDGEVHYYAKVLKDRTEVTRPGAIIENCTYDTWRAYFEGLEGCKTAETSYRKNYDTTVENMTEDADRAEELAAAWKAMMKDIKASGKAADITKINAKVKELGINVTALNANPAAALQQLHDFTALLVA